MRRMGNDPSHLFGVRDACRGRWYLCLSLGPDAVQLRPRPDEHPPARDGRRALAKLVQRIRAEELELVRRGEGENLAALVHGEQFVTREDRRTKEGALHAFLPDHFARGELRAGHYAVVAPQIRAVADEDGG